MKLVNSSDGTVIGVWQSGAGQPLLFVHGTTADHKGWANLAPHLDQHCCVYAMDRRGRGMSGDAHDYSIMREVEDVVAVVEAIGEPTCVFGHSYGGLCSLEAALLSDKIDRLILYEPYVPTEESSVPAGILKRIQELVESGELEAALELFMRGVAKISEHELTAYRQLPIWPERILLAPTIAREMASEHNYSFAGDKFGKLEIPTMLLLGGDSPPVYQLSVELVDATLPNSKIITLPGQQHMAHYTNPELLVQEILDFLPA